MSRTKHHPPVEDSRDAEESLPSVTSGGAGPGALRISIEPLGHHWVVVAEGEVNHGTRGELRRALSQVIDLGTPPGTKGDVRVAVDLRRAAFADACGWVALVDAHLALAARWRRLYVVAKPGGRHARQTERLGLGLLLTRIAHASDLC